MKKIMILCLLLGQQARASLTHLELLPKTQLTEYSSQKEDEFWARVDRENPTRKCFEFPLNVPPFRVDNIPTVKQRKHIRKYEYCKTFFPCQLDTGWSALHNKLQEYIDNLLNADRKLHQNWISTHILHIESLCEKAVELIIDLRIANPETKETLESQLIKDNDEKNGLYARTFPLQWKSILLCLRAGTSAQRVEVIKYAALRK